MENETKIIEQKQIKKKSPIIPIFLLILSIGLIACGILLLSTEEATPSSSNTEKEEVEEQTTNVKSIELTKENEELVVDDNLTIKFIGTKDPTMENAYQYKAEIYLNNELIDNNFFTGKNIYSTNYGATFDVTKIEDNYIIKSFIAKHCNGSFVLVLTKDKNLLSYDDVLISIDENQKQYTITKCSDCMNETTCTTETNSLK